MLTKDQLMLQLKLEPIGQEGGFFRRIYESELVDSHGRRSCASIYYLLSAPDFSCFHRIDCDEIWHFYGGDPLILYQILPGGELVKQILGNPVVNGGMSAFALIQKGTWFAAEVSTPAGFSLLGCTTIPEFNQDLLLRCLLRDVSFNEVVGSNTFYT